MGEAITGLPEDFSLGLSSETSEEPPELRLSLGGIYCGKSKENSLTRSSSVITESWKWDLQKHPDSFLSLARSCSLPAESEQMVRIKLKELQLLRRHDANKWPTEQRSCRAAAPADGGGSPAVAEVAAWAAASAAKSPALCRAIDKIKSTHGSLSQGYTVEGQGSGGSTRGSSGSQSSLESMDRDHHVVNSQAPAAKKPSKPPTDASWKKRKFSEECSGGMDIMRAMPSVTTTGDGPNGRKVEGFLYKYMKGQVCIVCVCHGSFLSPAEFVKHAGGGEVANPMKHIHVCCTSFA